jgi:hypothetical protein
MKKPSSSGKCNLCGGDFRKAAMTRHLAGCKQPKVSSGSPAKDQSPSFHLLVEGFPKAYWLHIAMPANAPLSILDTFLRNIWLECCGHMSAFSIEGSRYSAHPMEEMEERSASVAISKVLEVGTMFGYEYDYGSTTELRLKVVGLRDALAKKATVELLARNNAPQIICTKCKTGNLATQICVECSQQEDSGWLCDECSETHKCGEEMQLPVVNSPRAGVCAYTG